MILLQQNNEGGNERVRWQREKKCRIMNRNECEKGRADGDTSSTPKSLYFYIFTTLPHRVYFHRDSSSR